MYNTTNTTFAGNRDAANRTIRFDVSNTGSPSVEENCRSQSFPDSCAGIREVKRKRILVLRPVLLS